MKTLYDWHPEKRGWLLMPQGSASIRHSVIVSGLCGHDVFLEMYERGHLTGQALVGAIARYGAEAEAEGKGKNVVSGKNRLSYWFPILRDAGVPVPRTTVVPMSGAAQQFVWGLFDGRNCDSQAFDEFALKLGREGERLGVPFFLRSDETSHKHAWDRTCYVADTAKLDSHVLRIAEFCVLADIRGLPFDTWAVREMLPTVPAFLAFPGNMPITQEWRVFVNTLV